LFVGQVTSLLLGDSALFVGTSAGCMLEYDAESGALRRSFTGIDSDPVLLANNEKALFGVSTRSESGVLKFNLE
jgi:hypothetical protein